MRRARDPRVTWKDDNIDPCTQTDLENERLVIEGLAQAFPTHRVVGEEASSAAGAIPAFDADDVPTWIVDPIDGTQNFLHSLPFSAVSIALTLRGAPQVGVVYDPWRRELFVAVAGRGAYLDGRRLVVDPSPASLSSALVLTDPGYERSPTGVAKLATFYKYLLDGNVRAVRILGSSVLSTCWVAASRASAFVVGLHEGDAPKPWDWAASTLVAAEAGCTVLTLDDRRSTRGRCPPCDHFDLHSKSIVCTHDPGLAAHIKELAAAAS